MSPTRLALLLAAAFAVFAVPAAAAPPRENPFRYDVDGFTRVDPSLLLYEEVRTVRLPAGTPRGLSVDRSGTAWVAAGAELWVVPPDGRPPRRIRLEDPADCVARDGKGTLYVGVGDHVDVYGPGGTRTASWTGLGEKSRIVALAVRGDDVFAADYGQRLVWRFDRSGRLLGRFGEPDPARNWKGFILPSPCFDLAVGPDGALWATNPGEQRVVRLGDRGEILASWGKASMEIDGFVGCCNPTNISVLPDGAFATSEKGIPRVKVHGRDGRLRAVVAGPASFRPGTAGLDLGTDAAGRIYVLDPPQGVLRIFAAKDARGAGSRVR